MDLFAYLKAAKSAAHLVDFCKQTLLQAGWQECSFSSKFALEPGGAYFTVPYPTCLFAFRIPEKKKGFQIACAHTDAPCLKIKPSADLPSVAGCNTLNVELYGGMLKRTWFDRPLAIAGQVMLAGDDVFSPKQVLFDTEKPWAVLPSLAPHMDHEIEKKEIEKQKEMMPVYLLGKGEMSFTEMLAEEMNVPADEILSFDLNLYSPEDPCFVGPQEDMLSASRIDNVSSVAALMEGIMHSENAAEDRIPVIALMDHEEVGSRSKQGADSELLSWVLQKIADGVDCSYPDLAISSRMLSVDVAHAVHPNYPEKADPTNQALLGKGFVLKTSMTQRYVTDVQMSAIVTGICQKQQIPMQIQANRNSIPGGQTLGPIASSYLPIPAADLGIPILAMHSIRELCSMADYEALLALMRYWL